VGEDPLVREMDEMIRRIKRENEERVSYMTFAMKMMEERKEGFREGERQGFTNGLAEGKAEGVAFSISNMMKNLGVSVEKAMDILQIPAAERTKYAALVRQ